MERIGAAEARDHMEMVERILAEVHPRLCAGGEYFVIWGLASAYVTLAFNFVARAGWPVAALWSVPGVLGLCAIFSIIRGRAMHRALTRTSLVQREFFNVLWLALGLAFVVDVAAFRLFPGIAGAAIWSVAEALVLLYIGLHGNRRAQIGGVLVVVSLVAANFVAPDLAAYVLAGGMIAGYAGFGAAELLSRT